jgi:hypothetical protein
MSWDSEGINIERALPSSKVQASIRDRLSCRGVSLSKGAGSNGKADNRDRWTYQASLGVRHAMETFRTALVPFR